jgi:hypothetical protein
MARASAKPPGALHTRADEEGAGAAAALGAAVTLLCTHGVDA